MFANDKGINDILPMIRGRFEQVEPCKLTLLVQSRLNDVMSEVTLSDLIRYPDWS